MFGRHAAKREKKKAQEERARLEEERKRLENAQPGYDQKVVEAASTQADQFRQDREAARQRGREYGEQVLNRDVQGLTPRQRQSMEEGAQKKLNREMQGYQRKLLAQQGSRGVKGGAAYAQQADLARAGQEAQSQYMRDIDQLDADASLKKLGALFGIEQGEAAQTQLDKQLALDMARMDEERKRQRQYEGKSQDYFARV